MASRTQILGQDKSTTISSFAKLMIGHCPVTFLIKFAALATQWFGIEKITRPVRATIVSLVRGEVLTRSANVWRHDDSNHPIIHGSHDFSRPHSWEASI